MCLINLLFFAFIPLLPTNTHITATYYYPPTRIFLTLSLQSGFLYVLLRVLWLLVSFCLFCLFTFHFSLSFPHTVALFIFFRLHSYIIYFSLVPPFCCVLSPLTFTELFFLVYLSDSLHGKTPSFKIIWLLFHFHRGLLPSINPFI